jgi:AcrR family transcriptional regulator
MPKVSDEHREQRRKQILDAALRCFTRKGFSDTSMGDIIAESGLSAGAIYGHYRSKSELVAEAAVEVFSPTRPELQPSFEADGMPSHPLDFADHLSGALLDDVGGYVLPLQVWGQAVLDEELKELFSTVFQSLRTGIRGQIVLWLTVVKGLEPTDAEARADALASVTMGLLQGAVVQTGFVSRFDRGAYLRLARPIFDVIEP